MEVNQNVSLLQNTITQLKQDAEKFLFEAEEKTKLSDIKSVISKSIALKRAAQEKQDSLDQLLVRKKMLQ